ncbi:MAG: hypothetical protein H0U56_09880 [Methylibium sp.]|uniref:hypothetical protein n=1 Tax=Methylibium sp. TaxID=2067992 RepID=UPI001819AAA6|nr:hypothetical protein [Methylibium sp.]MBA2723181.1 hypothetical protein [Methylibium sp.]MBA3588037.1 hypothetical protein [Methylibium sp.]
MTALTRLHLATRIHLALLRELKQGIDVRRMLSERDYAEEVLEICRGIDDLALLEMADRFDDESAAEDAKAHMAEAAQRARAALAQIPKRAFAVPQDLAWSRHTSGFGVTQAPAGLESAPASLEPTNAPRSRFAPADWLRLAKQRGARH